MRITIDTNEKTVEAPNESLHEVVDCLSKAFPDTWKEFKLTAASSWTIYQPPMQDYHTYCTTISNQQN